MFHTQGGQAVMRVLHMDVSIVSIQQRKNLKKIQITNLFGGSYWFVFITNSRPCFDSLLYLMLVKGR